MAAISRYRSPAGLAALFASLFLGVPSWAPEPVPTPPSDDAPTTLPMLRAENVVAFLARRGAPDPQETGLAEVARIAFVSLYPPLGARLTPEQYERLDPRLGSDRQKGIEWLAYHGAVFGLERALVHDPSTLARAAAARSLSRASRAPHRIFSCLLRALRRDPDAGVRAAAAEAIAGLAVRFEGLRARAREALAARTESELAQATQVALDRALQALATVEASCPDRLGQEPQ